MTLSLRIALVAGEPSGDLLAAPVIAALAQRFPQARFEGIGGPCMAERGFVAWWPMTALSVHGFVDALAHYREIKAIRDALAARLLADPPDLFIGVDAPDFNLGLERRLKRAGIRTVHFVSPSIWAWRRGRLRHVPQSVDLMLCLFPFEPELYVSAGVAATCVGHPLADAIPRQPDVAAARVRLGLDAARRWIAVLPGSREGEVRRLGRAFAATIAQLLQREPGRGIVVPAATPALRAQFETLLADAGVARGAVTIVDGHSHDAIEAAEVVLVASGTATLECALYRKPMVIAYKVSRLTHWLMKRLAYLPWIGLPNILLGASVVPEFVQDAATPQALTAAVERWLGDAAARASTGLRLAALHDTLARDAGARVVEAVTARWPELAVAGA